MFVLSILKFEVQILIFIKIWWRHLWTIKNFCWISLLRACDAFPQQQSRFLESVWMQKQILNVFPPNPFSPWIRRFEFPHSLSGPERLKRQLLQHTFIFIPNLLSYGHWSSSCFHSLTPFFCKMKKTQDFEGNCRMFFLQM